MSQSLTPDRECASPPPDVEARIRDLVPYRPGKPIEELQREQNLFDIVKLASNENSLGPAPRAVEAMRRAAERMHLYPDASAHDLCAALGRRLDVEPECLVLGNGSDDIIHLLGITFLEQGDEVIQASPSFVRYAAAATLNSACGRQVPLTADWTHDLPAMADQINSRTRLIFLCNPNNPTGTIVSRQALNDFLDRLPDRALAVVDEAYFEYAADDPEYPDTLRHIREGRNVVTLRTFSKAYGLAGLRIGYGVMRPEIAEWLHRAREPFNVNLMAQHAALAALEDHDHLRRTLEMNAAGKQVCYAAFERLGLRYTPTHGNFIWVDVLQDCRSVYQALLRRGVITRTGDIFGAPTHLRVTLGTEVEIGRFLQALREALAS